MQWWKTPLRFLYHPAMQYGLEENAPGCCFDSPSYKPSWLWVAWWFEPHRCLEFCPICSQMTFLWFSQMFPWMSDNFPWCLHDLPIVFANVPMIFPTISLYDLWFSQVFQWSSTSFSHAFLMMFRWLCHAFPIDYPMIFQWLSNGFPLSFPLVTASHLRRPGHPDASHQWWPHYGHRTQDQRHEVCHQGERGGYGDLQGWGCPTWGVPLTIAGWFLGKSRSKMDELALVALFEGNPHTAPVIPSEKVSTEPKLNNSKYSLSLGAWSCRV